jgi:Xaa-Pro aminopeptidase
VSRADRVAERLAEGELDLLLVTNLVNLRYVTGFTGSNGFAVVGRDVRRFVTDFRYVEQAARQVEGFDREQGPQDFVTALADGWPDGELRLGFEDDHVSVRRHARIREVLPDRIELVPAGGVVEGLRAVKDAGEIERIAAAAALADDVYGTVREQGLVGRTERDVAFALEHEMRRRGAQDPSFPSIVASGERGALPHAVPTGVPIPPGTLVTLDIGARLDGYCSDCTRTWATGELPDDLAAAYELVRRAQEVALAAVRPGPEGREVDAVARRIIEEAGHGEHFGHGLGHGVGMEVHEAPRLARTAEARLVAGNVVTVEPGVYLPGRGGVRIEDLVVVTEDGHRVLSGTTKELVTVE